MSSAGTEERVPSAGGMEDQEFPTTEQINRDLGFGTRVAEQSRLRFLNRDGSFNVVRSGHPLWRRLNLFHAFLTMPWPYFFTILAGAYFLTNLLFALAYTACGTDALLGSAAHTPGERILEAFFFSVQTLATIGYGRLSPSGLAANSVATIEALVGLLGFALATGLLFARFSRPNAQILFSRHAVIAPYRGRTAFMFRLANVRTSQLIEGTVTLVLAWTERDGGRSVHRFHPLSLERPKVVFLPLQWVVVHDIDESSPLHGVNPEQLAASEAEFLILFTAVDETFSQTVYSRSSYKHHEVLWGARFADMFLPSGDGRVGIDLRKIHDVEPAGADSR